MPYHGTRARSQRRRHGPAPKWAPSQPGRGKEDVTSKMNLIVTVSAALSQRLRSDAALASSSSASFAVRSTESTAKGTFELNVDAWSLVFVGLLIETYSRSWSSLGRLYCRYGALRLSTFPSHER